STRTYAGTESVVLAVDDPLLPANDGCYRVSGEGVARTDDAPDVRLDVTTLGSVYLGGPSFRSLAAGGRIAELVPGGLARADRLFHSPVAPWCGTHF
ncbi:MAG TPA: sterol carrier protein domain-containing protein, partial [Acidimicrobiales bacterium]